MDNNSAKMVERFDRLLSAINEDDSLNVEYKEIILETIKDSATAAPKYFNAVITGSIATRIAYMTLEGEELRERVQKLDSDRRMAHIKLTDGINIVNR